MEMRILQEILDEIVQGQGCIRNAIVWIPNKGEEELLNYAKVTLEVVERLRNVVIKRIDKLNAGTEVKMKMLTFPAMPDEKTVKIFKGVFGIELKDYCDTLTSCMVGKFIFGIFKFDNYLHDKFGDYESRGLSMEALIKKEYGDEALVLLKSII